MRGLFIFILTAALLITPALASEGPDSRSDDPDACPHSFERSEVRPATCTDQGLAAYTCSLCGLTYTEQTPADGAHDYVLTDNTAGCTEPGQAVYTCTRCGDSYAEPAPAAGHVPSAQAVTCTDSIVCTVCGQVLQRATGHDYVYQYDAETDGEGNYISYGTWQCANCGAILPATRGNAEYYGSAPGEGTGAQAPSPRQAGLWLAVSAGALVFILIEAVLLVRSLKKNKTTL